jgi:hypothetical protein
MFTLIFAAMAFAGLYRGDGATLEIQKLPDGKYECVVTTGGAVMHFTAEKKDDALAGKLEDGEEFRITVAGNTLSFTSEGETQTLTRDAGKPKPDAKALRINGVVIDEATVKKFEQEHRQLIPRGDFWYDKISGAWGVDGGPTLGFTAPGMNLGGPLKEDASRGDTGVFINGRQLPWPDVQGLQAMGVPVERGRWWVDSQGNYAAEGEMTARGNLFQFSKGRGGAYQRATAGGYIGGDGQTSYFFDPSTGASVMTGN